VPFVVAGVYVCPFANQQSHSLDASFLGGYMQRRFSSLSL